jgi:hypothetical protein
MGHLLWWPINGLRIESDAIQISLTFLPVQHSDKLLWRIGILTQRSICFYWKITRPRWQRQVVLDTTPRIEEGSIWMQESNVGKLWLAAKWATESPTHSSCGLWIHNTHNPPLPLQVLSYCCGVELQWSSADFNRNFCFFRSHFFEVRPQWVSSHIESSRSKCPPPIDNWILSKCSKKCHHISHCFTILYSTNSSNIPTLHMLHGTGWCILFQIFGTKKLMFLTARQKYSLYDPIFSCQKFPSKVSIKFANKKKQSLSLLLVVCGRCCHF